jgi:cob(I)alamin adenosyltransferase
MAFKVYTKTGDKGKTSLIGGKRVQKFDDRIEAYGTVDELIAFIALTKDLMNEQKIENNLLKIQSKLMTVASILATEDKDKQHTYNLLDDDVTFLENEIDEMDKIITPLTKFILPGGHILVSYCHISRTICRRSERKAFLLSENFYINPIVLTYLNRLSDYLFTLSRYISFKLNIEEIEWLN